MTAIAIPIYPRHLLDGTLLELLRIRSAQLGGCEPCMASRKVEGATEEVVACLTNPSLRGRSERSGTAGARISGSARHRSSSHWRRSVIAAWPQHFTTAEIIELGTTCGHMIGTHRFLHTLDVFGDADPIIPYAPEQVGATWAELHGEAATHAAEKPATR